ncbi:MAG: hypothetical protein LQ348_007264 [Seirophora lacunosa]|nr:MAG: hypothetical protein LQ348_007264 [Seirophora lacunosa]
MSSLSASLQNLISAILSIFNSLFHTFYAAFDTLFTTASNLLHSIADLMSGFVGFVLGNIVIIGFLVAAFVGYSAYQQKAGRNKRGGLKTS